MELNQHQTLFQIQKAISQVLSSRPLYQGWPEEEREMQTRYEAQTLLLHGTGMSRVALLASMSDTLDEKTLTWLQSAVQSRLSGMPLAYIVASANFYGRDFKVGPGCLIPRPETEILVEEAGQWIQKHKKDAHVYDLGTGSGAIAITISLECKNTIVEAVDISKDALTIASENSRLLHANVSFHQRDGLNDIVQRAEQKSNQIHVFISNPPYIPSKEMTYLEPDVLDYEPNLALDGGEDGLFYYETILSVGDGFFVPGESAALFFEVGIGQAQTLITGLNEGKYPKWQGWHFSVKNDLRKVPRVVFGERIQTEL